MTFTSIAFIFFFVAIVFAYYVCPQRFRWVVLLLGSCYFYMAFVPKYILILFFLILVDFVFAQQIERSTGVRRRAFFLVGLVINIGTLFLFKYFNFFNDNVSTLAHALHWNYSIQALRLILPLGLSFHTFQSISYLIEVYKGRYPAERHLGIYALYVMFFPQLIAGPIERPAHLIPQFKKAISFQKANLFSGIRLMAWGFFKKMVVADRLAFSINYIYANTLHVSGPSILFAMLAFSFQLYADFSGYTDIARGSARVLGVDLVRNFEQPYFSRSIAEFWRRWHISLSSWFRDYVFLPLMWKGKSLGVLWSYIAILVTFLLTGVWHGASWTFVVMGFLFGLYIVLGLITALWRERVAATVGINRVPRLRTALQTMCTFVLVSTAFVFFRSPDMSHALTMFKQLSFGWGLSWGQFIDGYILHTFPVFGVRNVDVALLIVFIAILLLVENYQRHDPEGLSWSNKSLFVKSFLYTALALSILMFGVFATDTFIYFQF